MSIKNIVMVVVVIIVGALALESFYIVDSRERALLLQFGEAVRSNIEPGFHFKLPIAQDAKKFDGRILTLDTPAERYFTVEKKPLMVDLFVKWRIEDVETYYTATSGEELRAMGVLGDRVNEGLRNQIGRRDMHEVISGERDQLMNEITLALNEVMTDEFGMKVVDVRVKRIDLPDEVSEAVFSRMNSEREIEAKQYRATGQEQAAVIRADADRQAIVIDAEAYRDAEKVRGEGDAKAAELYAHAYGQDPDFYAFYRSINAYKTVFEDGNAFLVVDPSREAFFKYLKSRDG